MEPTEVAAGSVSVTQRREPSEVDEKLHRPDEMQVSVIEELDTPRDMQKTLGEKADEMLSQMISLAQRKISAQMKVILLRARKKYDELQNLKGRLQKAPYNGADDFRYNRICETLETLEGEYAGASTQPVAGAVQASRKLHAFGKKVFVNKPEH